jgi:hypothetical protein
MRRISRDAWLTLALFVILLLITLAAAVRQARAAEAPALSSSSNAPNGGRALRLWLEALGYQVEVQVEPGSSFQIPEGVSLVLMLEPVYQVTPDEWRLIDAWIEAGGTLILAGEGWITNDALSHFDYEHGYVSEPIQDLKSQTPLLVSPPLYQGSPGKTNRTLQTSQNGDAVVHLAAGARPLLVSLVRGEGRVVLSSLVAPFSNAGLKQNGNPQLVLNLVALAQPGSVWFDEYHHGMRTSLGAVIGPGQWLRRTPAGRALLFVLGVVFLALILQGRAFGRPIPLPHELNRRAPLETITALAMLSRRAGHRAYLLRHFHQQLKRSLGRRLRLDPGLPDEEYLRRLSQIRPELDAQELSGLLKRLSQKNVSEREMVELARQASGWIEEKNPETRKAT